MKKPGFFFHALYRFPSLYLSTLAVSVLTIGLLPPNGIPYTVTLIISLLFSAIMLCSAARVMIIFEERKNLYVGDKTPRERLLYLLKRLDIRLFLLLLLLLPFPIKTLTPVFGSFSPLSRYLLSRLFAPLLALALLLGCMTGLSYYERNEKKKELRKKINRSPFLFIFHVFKYVPLYTVGAYCLLAFSVVLFSIPGILALILTTSLGGTVLVALIAVWTVRAVRAIRKRRRFLDQLKDACRMSSIPIPHIDSPIRSLFRRKERASIFHLTVDGRKYACRLISALKPVSVYRLYPSGEIGRIRVTYMRFTMRGHAFGGGVLYRQRAELYETKYALGFEADEDTRKIFILNPTARTVEGQYGTEIVPLDNGMRIGEYTFYTATGFTNAIKRNCLHRRANE